MHCWKALQKFLIPHKLALGWLLWVYEGYAMLWIYCWFVWICKLGKHFLRMHLSSFKKVDFVSTIAALVRRSEILCFFNTAEVLGIALSTISLMDFAVLLGVFVTTDIRTHTLMTWHCHNLQQHLPDHGNYIGFVAFSKSCAPNDSP